MSEEGKQRNAGGIIWSLITYNFYIQTYDQSCAWVGLTHGLVWVELGWVMSQKHFQKFENLVGLLLLPT